MKILTALFLAAVVEVAAQSPQVPHKMEFGGITLIIRDDARREIQKDVDAYTASPKHYMIKVERAKTYFPIIEKIFQEEQIPEDFKYLVLQESALIADAVSTSNAVGFWQFKDFTAIEMGLRVDKDIDERLNIVSSSRAAARYIKKNNGFFNNWVHALQAYQMGAGGAMKAIRDNQPGASRMEITGDTYWYVKKFLAHKVAYEPAVSGKGEIEVTTYANSSGKSIRELARETSVDEADLQLYNKWTRSGSVPSDRTYAVIIPLPENRKDIGRALIANSEKDRAPVRKTAGDISVTKKVNGVLVIQALSGENADALASRAGVELSKFLKWNDLGARASQNLSAGEFYFLSGKRLRASENFHKVAAGENLWTISQRFGVKLKRLRRYNRLRAGEDVGAGMMLYLASKRPKVEERPAPVVDAVAVDSEQTFNWTPVQEGGMQVASAETVQSPVDSLENEVPIEQKPADSPEILQEPVLVSAEIEDSPGVMTNEAGSHKSEHLVEAGQTLYSIAKRYNVTVMELVSWNNLDLQQGIKPGQVLKLSDGQTISAAGGESKTAPPEIIAEIVHEVKVSDTLYSIARQYGVTIKDLMDWNGKKDFSLAVGEKLKIQQPR